MDWIDELSKSWQREYPDLDTSALPPLVRVARMAVLIEAFQQQVIEPFELTSTDYSVLAALRRAGKPYQLSPSLLYSRLQRSSGGMTKMLKRLEERDLIVRAADPDDGRGSIVKLTRRGIALQEQIFNAFLTASDTLLSGSDAGEKREIDETLRALLERFEKFLHV